ncbi:DUF5412 family protein [Virgibacillus xinjiangensis]|uniref:DUF5412 family protein n=1 Tax=Virgibacillus xinjiangensis TaxID=393090 RepID=A0ABV7CXW3_9BACI
MIGIALVFLQAGYTKYFFTFDTDDGEFYRGPVSSPTGEYTANAYYRTYGGAAGGVDLWVEVKDNKTNEAKTIYYSDAKSRFSMEWADDDTLSIDHEEPAYPNSDRSVALDVEKEVYHDQGLACDSWVMKGEYETCHQAEG